MGVGIGAFAVRKRQRREAHKVVRKFFGDSAPPKPRFDVTQQLGVQEPLGFWDPLGLAADGDDATFKRRRAVEIKHGRVCMYATIGYIVPEYFKFPGYLSPSTGLKFEDVPNGLAALSKVPLFGWLQIFAFAGVIETTGFFSGSGGEIGFQKDSTEAGEPGNYGVGFPNFLGTVDDAEARSTKLAAELANGRLAMMAIIGMFFQDGLTGSAWGDWSLYTASPLRAAARKAEGRAYARGKVARNFFFGDSTPPPPRFDVTTQLGVQDPLGFWDPLGLAADGDEATFKRRRAVEIKHGRVCMYATIGYIVP